MRCAERLLRKHNRNEAKCSASVLPSVRTLCMILQMHEHIAMTLQLRVSKHDDAQLYDNAYGAQLPITLIYTYTNDIHL